ncbi:hypothetical protein [Planomicrobium sp. CPCC 101110]|uniref:hypothetical protein n=1 Tax=Planomicrobium sp. CPCC 101110 TaxID=2599619 RepID=UPI0011B6F32D|nr:hypothetical protein [Planomicrobium sp. CPCC 101110]TWT26567.1 hypothetical protein FQV30_07765 [Planomicrobium sp. CPCC 101110]
MKLEILTYKKYKGIVTSSDYIRWASFLLEENDSIELAKLATMNKNANLFEVEELFQKVLSEINLKMPSVQEAIYGYISCLEKEILQNSQSPILVANKICQIAYSEGLEKKQAEWYEISEWIDRLEYDSEFQLSKEEVENKIRDFVLTKD